MRRPVKRLTPAEVAEYSRRHSEIRLDLLKRIAAELPGWLAEEITDIEFRSRVGVWPADVADALAPLALSIQTTREKTSRSCQLN